MFQFGTSFACLKTPQVDLEVDRIGKWGFYADSRQASANLDKACGCMCSGWCLSGLKGSTAVIDELPTVGGHGTTGHVQEYVLCGLLAVVASFIQCPHH